jgi:hypothetical protein
MGGVDQFERFSLHICEHVFTKVGNKKRTWVIPASIILHDMPGNVYQTNIVANT